MPPTEPAGSLPRPMKLQQAYAEYDAGNIWFDGLKIKSRFKGATMASERLGI